MRTGRHRLGARLVAVALVYLFVPGSAELTKDVVHLVTTGHSTHSSEHEQPLSAEHGCSGPYHQCMCHSSATFVAAPSGPAVHGAAMSRARFPERGDRLRAGHRTEIERPPSA